MLIRKARMSDIRGLARVHVDSWETTYRGIIPDEVLDKRTYESSEAKWLSRLADVSQTRFTLVAETDAGKIVGFASGGEAQDEHPVYKGEVYALYILKEYQRAGIGRLLVKGSAERLRELGFEPMLIWVLEANPACGFYERIGGRFVETKTMDFAGKELTEIGYGWDDLDTILDTD